MVYEYVVEFIFIGKNLRYLWCKLEELVRFELR